MRHEATYSAISKTRHHMLDKRKELLSEEIESYDKDFSQLCDQLQDIKNKTRQFLEGLLQINVPEEFNKEFAKSRSLIAALEDYLSTFKTILADNFIKEICLNTSFCKDEPGDLDNSQEVPLDFNKLQYSPIAKKELPNEGDLLFDQEISGCAQIRNSTESSFFSGFSTFSEEPIAVGFVEGIIPLVLSPWMFYFQPMSLLPLLEVMQDSLNAFMTRQIKDRNYQLHSHKSFQISSLLAAQFSVDEKWYRARIISIAETDCEPEYEVLFLDYGNSEILQLSSLDQLPVEFASLPGLAICCSLNNVSPPREPCTWPDKSLRTLANLVSQHGFYEPVTIKPLSTINNALTFVSLFKRNSKLCQNHTCPLDVTQELNQLGCLNIVQSNQIAVNWFEYFCSAEDKKRNYRGDTFIRRVKIFNSPKILNSQNEIIQSFRQNHNHPKQDVLSASPGTPESAISRNQDVFLQNPSIKKCDRVDKLFPSHKCQTDEENADDGKIIKTSAKSDSEDTSYIYSLSPKSEHFQSCFLYKPIFITDGEIRVHISHIESPSCFWVLLGDDALEQLEKINLELMVAGEKMLHPCPSIEVDMACLVHFNEDEGDGLKMYRSQIRSVFKNEDLYEIKAFLVDYGRTEVLNSSNNVFKIPEHFVNIPPLAVQCKLEGIECKDEVWSEEALRYFKNEVSGNKGLYAYFGVKYSLDDKVFGHMNESIEIDLRKINDRGNDESLITLMSNQCFAKLLVKTAGGSWHANGEDADHSGSITSEYIEATLKDEICKEFLSVRNSYLVDTDDPGVALTNYKTKDENKICKFFNKRGGCWYKEKCNFAHISESDGSMAMDTALVYSTASVEFDLELPSPGSWILVQVSAFVDPQNYSVIFPFGSGEFIPQKLTESPLDELMMLLNKHYNSKFLPDHDLTYFARGELVVARSLQFERWHRALIADCSGDDEYEVYYVDYGNTESLSPSRIRTIEPKFMHLPCQAVKSSSPISPISGKWSEEAIEHFRNLIDCQTLSAHILGWLPCGSLLLDLHFVDKSEEKNVCNIMVKRGHAIHSPSAFEEN